MQAQNRKQSYLNFHVQTSRMFDYNNIIAIIEI